MKVELLDHMGSDLDVVNAARVSFDKESSWQGWQLKDKDTKLIHYLAKHHHWTPFSHCYAKFRIKAPIFVARQLFKHKVGLTENEVSRRYVDSEPEFYSPDMWREKAPNVKQGSSDKAVFMMAPDDWGYTCRPETAYQNALHHYVRIYNWMLESGVAPEQARMILPQSMFTEWIWSGSIASFARVYQQRTSDHAQHETKQVALQIGELLEPLFPVSWKALTNA